MDESMMSLGNRLAAAGPVTLTDDERRLVSRSLELLGAAQRQIALQSRLLESHSYDESRLLAMLDPSASGGFPVPGIDYSAHARAREALADRLDGAASGAEWVGAVLDFVRIVAL